MRLVRLLAALMLAPGAAAAQTPAAPPGSAVTLYGAYRGGGNFADTASDRTLRLAGSGAWAVSYDQALDASRQLQIYVSYQSTHLGLDPSAAVDPLSRPAPARLPMKVIYFQLGGTSFFDGPIGRGPYVVGGLGATLFQPGSNGLGDEVRPSMNLGIGYQAPLSAHFAVRLEARGYFTLVRSSGGLFCSGGCVLQIKGDTVTQGEVQLGLSYGF